MSHTTFRSHTTIPAAPATYLHVRLLAQPAAGFSCVARTLRAQSRPPQLDWGKLAAMGVKRPTLKRRLPLTLIEFVPPPDAA
jgi:hypothetical protein